MTWIKKICEFLCIGGVKSFSGCIVGSLVVIPIAVLFTLPVGLLIGSWVAEAGMFLIGPKVEKIALIIGLSCGISLFVLSLLVIGITTGSFVGALLNNILNLKKS